MRWWCLLLLVGCYRDVAGSSSVDASGPGMDARGADARPIDAPPDASSGCVDSNFIEGNKNTLIDDWVGCCSGVLSGSGWTVAQGTTAMFHVAASINLFGSVTATITPSSGGTTEVSFSVATGMGYAPFVLAIGTGSAALHVGDLSGTASAPVPVSAGQPVSVTVQSLSGTKVNLELSSGSASQPFSPVVPTMSSVSSVTIDALVAGALIQDVALCF